MAAEAKPGSEKMPLQRKVIGGKQALAWRLGLRKGNLMVNGEFERPPANSGLDWRTGSTTYLAVDFSAPQVYHGDRSLRIAITISCNDDYEPVYQIVPVLPR